MSWPLSSPRLAQARPRCLANSTTATWIGCGRIIHPQCGRHCSGSCTPMRLPSQRWTGMAMTWASLWCQPCCDDMCPRLTAGQQGATSCTPTQKATNRYANSTIVVLSLCQQHNTDHRSPCTRPSAFEFTCPTPNRPSCLGSWLIWAKWSTDCGATAPCSVSAQPLVPRAAPLWSSHCPHRHTRDRWSRYANTALRLHTCDDVLVAHAGTLGRTSR